MQNYDVPVNRKNTNSIKWDNLEGKFNKNDLLPMWIADMDFKTAPQIITALKNNINENTIFGYSFFSNKYYESVINWLKNRHNFEIAKDWIVPTCGVVAALNYAIQVFSHEGDEIIVPTPVYPPFVATVKGLRRIAVESKLKQENGVYTIDFNDIESKITAKTKAIMICSPHNPVGRVWTKTELTTLANICEKHKLFIIDDEIHNDLTFTKNHIVIANISDYAANNSIICTSPCKTFNIPSIPIANIIIKNDEIREKFAAINAQNHAKICCPIADFATTAVYNECAYWLDDTLTYIEHNFDYFVNRINSEFKTIKTFKPQGTYLAWVDFTATGKTSDEIMRILVDDCKLVLNNGKDYGLGGDGFFRINLACPRANVEDAINRLKKYFD